LLDNKALQLIDNSQSEVLKASNSSRLVALDAWRGIAALLVALYRIFADGWLHNLPFVKNAYLFVDFFFVLSGFVIAYAYLGKITTRTSSFTFLVRRFGRVWPLHVFLLAIFVIFELLRGLSSYVKTGVFDAFEGFRSPITIVWEFFLVQSLGFAGQTGWNTPAWSISTEFWTYIVFAILCLAGRKLLLMIAPFLVIGGLIIVSTMSSQGMNTTFDFGFARCIAGFFTGVLVCVAWQKTAMRVKEFFTHFTLAEIMVVIFTLLFVSIANYSWLSFLAPLAFVPIIYIFAFEGGIISQILRGRLGQFLGELSYSIYMTALLVSLLFNKIAIVIISFFGRPSGLKSDLNANNNNLYDFGFIIVNDVFTLAYLLCVIGVSWVTYKFIENPSRHYFIKLTPKN
jgi:peptidoglycan/LPS O-acetylase OafA/YrhL